MIRRSALAGFLLLLVPAFALGGDPMDVDDVLKLLEAGISERVIVAQIEASGSDFDLSTDEIVSLQEQGVGERIIEAMIRSGSDAAIEDGGEEAIDEQEDQTVVVPAHLGFARYDHAGYVDIRLVPWSVPNVSYVYIGYDPWYWDPFWWDTPYYVSYHSYPRWYWGWGAGPWYYRPYGWYARNCYWPSHHDHYYASTHHYYNHPSSHDGVVSRSGTWKKKSVDRGGSSVTTVSADRAYRSGSKTTVRSQSTATPGTTYRSPRATTRKSTIDRTTTTRYRSESKATVSPRAPTRSPERAAPRSGSRTISRPSSGGSSSAARAAPSQGSSSSSSSGGRKSKGR